MTDFLMDTNHVSRFLADDLTVLSADIHFTWIDRLTIENWLAA